MKLDNHGNEIKFDATVGTVTQYILILDGEPTMHITCDSEDAEKVICIEKVDGTGVQSTKGRFELVQKLTSDADSMPLGVETRVDSKSVYKYVLPRVPSLLGRLLRATN